MTTIDTSYAARNEGFIYGLGAAGLAQRVAEAASTRETCAGRAKAIAKVLRDFCDETGMNPKTEVALRAPGEGWHGNCWYVGLEAGPYQWAIVASDALAQIGIFAEPYYSFDLCLWPHS